MLIIGYYDFSNKQRLMGQKIFISFVIIRISKYVYIQILATQERY